MRKIIILFFIYIVFFNNIVFSTIEEDDYDGYYLETQSVTANIKELRDFTITAKHILCFDRLSGTVVCEKGGYEKCKMASTTKIMTAIIAIEKGNLEDEVIISKNAASVGGSRLGLKANDKIKLKDLLYGLMLRSRQRCGYCNCRIYFRRCE